MQIDPSIFKSYDIRGIYPTPNKRREYCSIIKAIYKFFLEKIGKPQLDIVLAYDMRLSGPQLFEVAKKTLVELGANVIDVGQPINSFVLFCGLSL